MTLGEFIEIIKLVFQIIMALFSSFGNGEGEEETPTV